MILHAPLIRVRAEAADVDRVDLEPPADCALSPWRQLSGMPVPFVISAQRTHNAHTLFEDGALAGSTRRHRLARGAK